MAIERKDELRTALQEFLASECNLDPADYDDDTPLFTSNRLDSLDLIDLVAFIEEVADKKVNSFDVSLETLDTLNRILEFILRLKSGQA